MQIAAHGRTYAALALMRSGGSGQAGRHATRRQRSYAELRKLPIRDGPEAISLLRALTAYAKADRDDLTSADKKVLSRLVTAIKKRGTDK